MPDWVKSSPSPIPERQQHSTYPNPFLEKLSTRSSSLIIPKQRSSISRDLSREKSAFSSIIESTPLERLNEPVTKVVPAKKSKNTSKNKAPPQKRQTRTTTKRRKLTNEGSDEREIQQLEKMARAVR